MCDLFASMDARYLLRGKRILFLGDSNVRANYKDLVFLLENNQVLPEKAIRNKLGSVVPYDKVVKSSGLHRGRDYFEVRNYKNCDVEIMYYFITRCYNMEIEDLFKVFKKENKYPDVVIMNSCLWDISRWGPNGVLEYKDNMVKLMILFKKHLPFKTVFIWLTVPPISNKCKGGLLVKQVQFLEHSLRFDVMEANMFARELVVSYGFDVLDIHYYLRMQIHRRAGDGIHWQPTAVRHVTNLILTHICIALGSPLPGNSFSKALKRLISDLTVEVKEAAPLKPPVLPMLPMIPNHVAKLKSKFRPETAASPLRKAIKEKIELSKRKLNLDEESVLDTSSNSFVDVSFEESSDLYTSFEEKQIQLPSLPVETKKTGLSGPVRFRDVMRRNRHRHCPYSYNC